jgi:hypothetical protein
MRRGWAIRLWVSLALVLLCSGPLGVHRAHADDSGGDSEPVNRVTACGVERWAIKTGTDPDARLVNQKTIVSTTILHRRSLPAPAQPRLHNRVRPVETTVGFGPPD